MSDSAGGVLQAAREERDRIRARLGRVRRTTPQAKEDHPPPDDNEKDDPTWDAGDGDGSITDDGAEDKPPLAVGSDNVAAASYTKETFRWIVNSCISELPGIALPWVQRAISPPAAVAPMLNNIPGAGRLAGYLCTFLVALWTCRPVIESISNGFQQSYAIVFDAIHDHQETQARNAQVQRMASRNRTKDWFAKIHDRQFGTFLTGPEDADTEAGTQAVILLQEIEEARVDLVGSIFNDLYDRAEDSYWNLTALAASLETSSLGKAEDQWLVTKVICYAFNGLSGCFPQAKLMLNFITKTELMIQTLKNLRQEVHDEAIKGAEDTNWDKVKHMVVELAHLRLRNTASIAGATSSDEQYMGLLVSLIDTDVDIGLDDTYFIFAINENNAKRASYDKESTVDRRSHELRITRQNLEHRINMASLWDKPMDLSSEKKLLGAILKDCLRFLEDIRPD